MQFDEPFGVIEHFVGSRAMYWGELPSMRAAVYASRRHWLAEAWTGWRLTVKGGAFEHRAFEDTAINGRH